MSTPAQRSARAALDAARPAVARLDGTRGGEDLAADLIEIWGAVEAALRTLVGSNALTGQPLIREARQRQLINFETANVLAECEAVHMRLQDTRYRPADNDVNAVRNAYVKLDAALTDVADIAVAPRPAPMGGGVASAPAAPTPGAPALTPTGGRPRWLIPTIAFGVLVLAVAAFFLFRPSSGRSYQQGVAAYAKGQREVAVSAFTKAVRENPKDPMPHVYLARMAREVGNFSLAGNEAALALEADPNNPVALREMAANLLQQNNNELARRFYIRAIQADPTDKTSQGYLGCALMRLGRAQEAQNFLTRAGPGPWTSCTAAAPQPQATPGAAIPR